MQAEKPHKGPISGWTKLMISPEFGLGYCVCGIAAEHPEWGRAMVRTSYVVKHDEATGEIETRNSRYTLVGAEIP